MRAGALHKYVSIVQPIKVNKDEFGADIFHHPIIAQVYAEIISRPASEYQVFGTTTSKQRSQIRLRYTKNVDRTMQIWWLDKKYSINSIINVDERNKEILLEVSEVV